MVVAVVDDLFFSIKIKTAAQALAADVYFERAPEKVLDSIRSKNPRLVIFDLDSMKMRPMDMIAAMKADATLRDVPTLGFVSHVHDDVIARARAAGIDARGPYAPDTVFMRARHAAGHAGEFDLVVAMTHDHGLIPVKYLGVERGVNVTLGLPFVRTSPDHGTAFDIAGQGVADPRSLEAAIAMARRMVGAAGVTGGRPAPS